MTFLTMSRPRTATRRRWMGEVARRGRAIVALWRLRANQRAELERLSDRDLRDMGLSRNEARFEMNKPFWRA